MGGVAVRWAGMACVSGVAYALLYPPFGWTALSWVALVPLYLTLRSGLGALRAAGSGALFMFVGTAGIVAWLAPTASGHFERPVAQAVILWLSIGPLCTSPYYAVAFAPLSPAFRTLSPSLRPLAFAIALVAAELARTHLGLKSPWSLLGDAHAGSPWLRQLASLGGVYLVSGVVAWVNGAIGEAWLALRAREHGRLPSVLAAPAIAVALALVFGALRVPGAASGESVLLVQGNVDQELRWERAGVRRVFQRYGELTRDALIELGDQAPLLVVWPESALQIGVEDPSYGLVLRRISKHVPLLLGAPHAEIRDGRRSTYNSASLMRGELTPLRYDKRRLLPFSETSPLGGVLDLGSAGDLDPESFAAGGFPAVFEVGGQRAGLLICMEALYPQLGRELVELGATFLVNLSNDGWYRGHGAARQHLEQVRFRAIETGLPVVRATTTGISAVIDPLGEVVALLGEGEAGVLDSALPAPRPPTLYAQVGDAFAGLCLAAWLCGAGVAIGLARRSPAQLGRSSRAAVGSRPTA